MRRRITKAVRRGKHENADRAFDIRFLTAYLRRAFAPPMRLAVVFLAFLASVVAASADFTLDLNPVSAGTAELRFTREPGYYYCLEQSTDLDTGFTQASGWMLGDGNLVTWPIQYNVTPPSGGGASSAGSYTFTLFPFSNGKTLVSWFDGMGTRYNALVAEDYTELPPIIIVPGDETKPELSLLIGQLSWDSAYEALTA